MKIGAIYQQELQAVFPHERLCAELKKTGLDCLDFSICQSYGTPPEIFSQPRSVWMKKYESIAKIIKANGLAVEQTHCTYPTNFLSFSLSEDKPKNFQQEELDAFKKELEASAILGAKYVVIHPINTAVCDRGKEENFKLNLEAFSMLEPALKEFDVKLGVENMFTVDPLRRMLCETGCSTPEDMIRLIDTLNETLISDRFVACLDTGHMFINAISPDSAVRKLGDRLKLLHVHDNDGRSDHHTSPGIGRYEWRPFAKALKDIGYDGALNIELSISRVMAIDPELAFDYYAYTVASARRLIEIAEV